MPNYEIAWSFGGSTVIAAENEEQARAKFQQESRNILRAAVDQPGDDPTIVFVDEQ